MQTTTMLYTRKGDSGTTGTFGDKKRMSKSSALSEALGTMDELNSFLGLCKVETKQSDFSLNEKTFETIVHNIQKNLFIIQAELAGAEKAISGEKIKEMEKYIDTAEGELPPITSFFISGGMELTARFDVARTLVRRAERRAVAVHESGERELGENTRAYLNRLSSLLYALARLSNHKFGITEESPDYE